MQQESKTTHVLTQAQAKWIRRILVVIALYLTAIAIVTHYMTQIKADQLQYSSGEVLSSNEKRVAGSRGGGHDQIFIMLQNFKEYTFDDDRNDLYENVKTIRRGDYVEILHPTRLQSLLGPDESEILQIKKNEHTIYSLDAAKVRLAGIRNRVGIIALLLWSVIWVFSKANGNVL